MSHIDYDECNNCHKYKIPTWNLKHELHFCSNKCVAEYIENAIHIKVDKKRGMKQHEQLNLVDEVLDQVHSQLSDLFPKLRLTCDGSVLYN